jgi:hypothetical protein
MVHSKMFHNGTFNTTFQHDSLHIEILLKILTSSNWFKLKKWAGKRWEKPFQFPHYHSIRIGKIEIHSINLQLFQHEKWQKKSKIERISSREKKLKKGLWMWISENFNKTFPLAENICEK